jgi:hypothetical protein
MKRRADLSSSSVLRSRTSKFSVEEKDETIRAEEEDRLILLPNADGAEEEDKVLDTDEEHRLVHLLVADEKDETNDNKMEGRLVFLLGDEEEDKHVRC